MTTRILRCQELVTGSFESAQSDLAEQSLVVVKNTLDTSSTARQRRLWTRRPASRPPGPSARRGGTNSAHDLQGLNENTLSTSGGLAYRQPTFGSVSLFGSYSQAIFPNNIILENLVLHNYGYNLYAAGVTYTRRLGGRLEGSATVSYTKLDPDTSGSAGFSGLTYAVDGTYQVNARILLHATASRAAQPSNVIESNYSTDENYVAEANYLLGTRRLAHAHRAFARPKTTTLSSHVLTLELTRSTTDSVFLSATYTMNRRFSLNILAGEEERRANEPAFKYSSTKVGITFKATY